MFRSDLLNNFRSSFEAPDHRRDVILHAQAEQHGGHRRQTSGGSFGKNMVGRIFPFYKDVEFF